MTQTTAITEIIQTLADVESRFKITRTESEGFFPEWHEDLPEITEDSAVETASTRTLTCLRRLKTGRFKLPYFLQKTRRLKPRLHEQNPLQAG